jgi:hypothetical protein
MSVYESKLISMNTLPDAPKGAHVDLQAGKVLLVPICF